MEKTWIVKIKISKKSKDTVIKILKRKKKKVDPVLKHDRQRDTKNIEVEIDDLKKERSFCKIRLWMIVE